MMSLEQLLLFAARVVWRQRSLWLLGLLATSGGLTCNLATRLLFLSRQDGESYLDSPELLTAMLEDVSPAMMLGIVLVSFFALVIVWLLGIIAEGGLIAAVEGHRLGQPVELSVALRRSFGFLGRFIGVDTVLFFPLFLLTVALMLVGLGGLAGIVLAATRPLAQIGDLALVSGVTLIVAAPIVLLMVITTGVILLLRTLAFRAIGLEELGALAGIRKSLNLVRRKTLSIMIMALVLWALRSLVSLPVRLVTMALVVLQLGTLVAAVTEPASIPDSMVMPLAALGILLALLSGLIAGIMNAYSSSAWTIAYAQWRSDLG